MPDDRLFHPRLLQSDKVDRLTDFERGVWFVSRLVCDDFGVFRFNANALQTARFLERKPQKAIEKALSMVRCVGLLATFDHEGRDYAYQWDWQDWQKVTYPRGTLAPKPNPNSLALCSPSTQELFIKHPGGWGRKKQETLPERSENVSETVPERSENVSPKPLAVSRQPLAESHEPASRTREPIRWLQERYASLHLEIIGVGYIGNAVADYQEWSGLLPAFGVDLLEKLMVYWLHTDDEFTRKGTRTVAKFRSRASKYAEELKARKLA